MIDYRLKGKRIELIHTDDPYTKLRSGDRGTIEYTFENLDSFCISVNWDSGSHLSLIAGKDSYRVFEEKPQMKFDGNKLLCPYCNNPVWRYFGESITVYQEQHKGKWIEANRDQNTLEISEMTYWCQQCDSSDFELPEGYENE